MRPTRDEQAPRGLAIEQYAEFVAGPERLWSIIGSPRRLPEWTGVTGVEVAGPPAERTDERGADPAHDAWSPGLRVVVREGDTTTWTVLTVGQRVVEASAPTRCGHLGIGVRVIEVGSAPAGRGSRPHVDAAAHDGGAEPAGNRPPGSRVVFVARLEPTGSTLRARLRDLPAIRRRFDRWATALRDLSER